MLSDSDRVVDELLRWCKAHGIQIDERIAVARGDVGICILTQDAFIERRATLASIPKSAILSIRNCLLAEHIPQVIFGSEVLLGLALGLYGEILRGEASPWFGYLQSLPKHVSIALFWGDIGADEDERSASTWLKGTMAEKELSMLNKGNTHDTEKRPNHTVMELRRYYDLTVFPALTKANLKDQSTLEGFKHAYALVSSRAFIVDAYHGLAMVPIADAFNHSSENHVHLESDHEVCRTCGSLTECSHDMEDGDWSERATTSSRVDRTLNGLEEIENTCEMMANASVPPFTEVFNTYGEYLTNAQLLVRYGFALDGNDNDIISWGLRELLHFASVIMRNLDEADERCCDEELSSTDRDIGSEISKEEVTNIEGAAAAAASYERQDIPHYHLGGEAAYGTKGADMNDEDQVVKLTLGHILLERLLEVVDLWTCGASAWESSMLVYLPNGQGKQCTADSYGEDADVRRPSESNFEADFSAGDGNVEARREKTYFHERTKADTVELSIGWKHSQLCLALNDEAKISLHLWIFCVLLAMHTPRLFPHTSDPCSTESTSPDAELLSKSCSKELSTEPRRREDSEYSTFIHDYAALTSQTPGNASRSSIEEDTRSSAKHLGLATTAEEDVAVLRRTVLVQKVLEDLSQGSGFHMDVDVIVEKEGKTGSWTSPTRRSMIAWNQMFETKITLATKALAQGSPGIPAPSLFLPTDTAREKRAFSGNPRKRTRAGSTNSSASNQSEGTRDHILLRSTERIVAENCAQTNKENCNTHEITDYNIFEELRSGDTQRAQGIEPGGLSALLDYGDDSDNTLHSDSDPEVHKASAVGGALRKKYHLNGEASLADMDTRARPAQKSELENSLPLQEVISVLHDRRYAPRPSFMFCSRFVSADVEFSTAPDKSGPSSSRLRAGALNSLNSQAALERCDSENTLSEASLVQLVVSTAYIVARLCAARTCRMSYPNLDTAALGDVVDAIPLEKPQTRMVAQLALAERARLEGCASVWKELELLLTHS